MRTLFATALLSSTIALAAPPRPPAAEGPVMSPVAQARYRDAVAMVTAGNYSGATESLNALAGEFPRVAEIFASRCSAQLGLKHNSEAEADCLYALSLKPQLGSALYALAIAEENQGKTETAISHYRQYVAFDDAPFKSQAQARVQALTAVPTGPLPVAAPPPPGAAAVPAPAAVGGQRALGTIVVYRNHFMPEGFQQLTLFVDGRPVGDIGHDQFVEIQLEAGEHFVEARTAVYNVFERPMVLSAPVSVTSGTTYLNFDYVTGFPALVHVNSEQGRSEVRQDCHKAYTRRM